jgi:antitoxin VapB
MERLMDTAKVFWTGRSQAVRLPKEYRLASDEVRVRKHGNAVILEPIPDGWTWLDGLIGPVDDDFVRGTEEQEIAVEKPELDFFK